MKSDASTFHPNPQIRRLRDSMRNSVSTDGPEVQPSADQQDDATGAAMITCPSCGEQISLKPEMAAGDEDEMEEQEIQPGDESGQY